MRRIGRLSSELREAEPATPSSRQSVSPRRLPLVTSAPPPPLRPALRSTPPRGIRRLETLFPDAPTPTPAPLQPPQQLQLNPLPNSRRLRSYIHTPHPLTTIRLLQVAPARPALSHPRPTISQETKPHHGGEELEYRQVIEVEGESHIHLKVRARTLELSPRDRVPAAERVCERGGGGKGSDGRKGGRGHGLLTRGRRAQHD